MAISLPLESLFSMHATQLGNKKVMLMDVVELKEKKRKAKAHESRNDSKHPPQMFVDLNSRLSSFKALSVLFAWLPRQPERKPRHIFINMRVLN